MILCCGEALIDMLPRTLEAGEPAFMPAAGGAVFNTAIALARLGAPAGFLGGLSTDGFGDMLAGALVRSGVDIGLSPRSGLPTTLAFVTLVDGQASYMFYDENSAGRMVSADRLPSIPATIAAMHFGAISLAGEPCGAAYERLALREAKTRVISIDPNIRPKFITDESAYRARLQRMMAAADIVKVSDADLQWLAPGLPFEDFAASLLSRAASLVLLTRGAQGARAAIRGATVQWDEIGRAHV